MTTPTDHEVARLRYELSRLHARRSVRTALAVGALSRGGITDALGVLRGEVPRRDRPGPSILPTLPPYPHLRVVATGNGGAVSGAAAVERCTPRTFATVVDRDRPDLLLIDHTPAVGWDATALRTVVRLARRHGAAVVGISRADDDPPPHVDHVVAPDLWVTLGVPEATEQRHIKVPAAIDISRWSPVGLADDASADVVEGARELDVTDARRQPVVAVGDHGRVGAQRILELMAAGALVVCPAAPVLTDALAGLPASDRALLLVDGPAAIPASAAALLTDEDRRRRCSVRVRRHLHDRWSTRTLVQRIVTSLGIDEPEPTTVSVLLATRRPDRLPQVLADLTAQRHRSLELILLLHGRQQAPEGLLEAFRASDRGRRVVVESVDAARPLGGVLNAGLDLATGRYIAKMDDDDRYGPDHLGDLLRSLWYSGASVAGRRVHGIFHEDASVTVHPPSGGEERMDHHLPGATLLVPAPVLRRVRWRHVPNGVDTELLRSIHLDGGHAYSGHRYGFVRVRHDDHTSASSRVRVARATAGFDQTLLEA